MADFQKGIPDITVIVTKGTEYLSSIQTSEVYQVVVNTGDSYTVNVNQPHVITVNNESTYTSVADYATFASGAYFALTASYVEDATISADWNNLINVPVGLVSSSTQINTGSFSGTITSASYALTASYVSGAASQWDEVANKPDGLVSSSLQAVNWSVATASYAANATLPPGVVSSSTQIQLSEISGSIFSSTDFTFPQNLTIDGTLFVDTIIASSSIIYESGSTKFGDSIDDTHQFTGSVEILGDIWVTPGVVNNLTSSYAIKAENVGVISAGTYETGSQEPIAPLIGITKVISASYANTASYAVSLLGGGITSSLLSVDTYYFVGDGATTNYSLPKEYTDDSLIVTVGGVTLISPNDYTINTNIVSFFDAPFSGSNIFVRGFVNVTQNATGSFSGSFIGVATTSSYAITASHVSEIVLSTTAPAVPKNGSVYFSGSYLYVYDGSQYRSASLN